MEKNVKKIVKFLISGGCSAAFEYVTFIILLHFFAVAPIYAQPISFACGVITSYTLNKFWVFASDKKTIERKETALFASLAIFNLLVTTSLMGLFVHTLHIPAFGAKLFLMLCVATWNYIIFNKIIFKVTA